MQKIQKGSKSSGEKGEKKVDIPQFFNVLVEMEVNHQIAFLDCFFVCLFLSFKLEKCLYYYY